VRLALRGSTLVLDPFSGGEPLSEQDLRKLLRRVIAGSARAGLRSAGDVAAELPLDQFLEPAGHRQILARVLRNLKNIYRDKELGETALRASALDWTLVYPTGLVDGPATGHCRVGERLPLSGFPRIARADVADFLLNQIDDPTYVRKGVLISS